MATIGTITRYVIVLGILAFIVLACIPDMQSYAIAVTLITPIVAAGVAGFELMYHKKLNAGFAMIAAVALVVCALLFGVAV